MALPFSKILRLILCLRRYQACLRPGGVKGNLVRDQTNPPHSQVIVLNLTKTQSERKVQVVMLLFCDQVFFIASSPGISVGSIKIHKRDL